MKSLFSSFSTAEITRFSFQKTNIYSPAKQYKPVNPQSLKNPYPKTQPSKFPKKYIRKQSQMNMLSQSVQNQRRCSIRKFHERNQSSLQFTSQAVLKYQRKRNCGQFCHWAQQTQNNTLLQLKNSSNSKLKPNKKQWICQNRKALAGQRRVDVDPILTGTMKRQVRTYLEKIEKQQRRHRDHGQRIKDRFIWQNNKPKTYLEKFRAARGIKTQAQ